MEEHPSVKDRIEGWKALSTFTGFSVGILKGASTRGEFPVYRFTHLSNSRVFFLKGEISRWLDSLFVTQPADRQGR